MGESARDQRAAEMAELDQAVNRARQRIQQPLLVLSGKGGVGKSTIAAGLAAMLAARGSRAGLMDVDLHGPSIPNLLGLLDRKPEPSGKSGITPIAAAENLWVVSIAFFLESRTDAVIWRGPLKMGAIKQFIGQAAWGDLDYLVVDSPPGTGDEPLSVGQCLPKAKAVVVTTPQDLSLSDVRRSISFCRALNLPVLGVIENMSGWACPSCGQRLDLFKRGGGERMAAEMNVPFLGALPIDPALVTAGDEGRILDYLGRDGPVTEVLSHIVETILAERPEETKAPKEANAMRYAIPLAEGRLAMHFGHCEQFALVAVDDGEITGTELLTPPAHEPGALPKWLAARGAQTIIAGGMGQRAQGLFAQSGIQVLVGAPSLTAEDLVRQHLAGVLQTGDNICEH